MPPVHAGTTATYWPPTSSTATTTSTASAPPPCSLPSSTSSTTAQADAPVPPSTQASGYRSERLHAPAAARTAHSGPTTTAGHTGSARPPASPRAHGVRHSAARPSGSACTASSTSPASTVRRTWAMRRSSTARGCCSPCMPASSRTQSMATEASSAPCIRLSDP